MIALGVSSREKVLMKNESESSGEVKHTPCVAGGRRLDSIDIMRTVAILCMVLDHFDYALSFDPKNSIPRRIIIIIGSVAAPIFTFLVGVSLQLTLDKGKHDMLKSTARSWWRGVFFLYSNLFFTVMVWSPQYVFDCDILSFIGLAILIMSSLRRLSTITMILIVAAILLASPPLRSVSGYANHWDAGEYTHDFTIQDVILGILLNGYFPLLPWLVFPLSGFAMAKLFLGRNPRRAARGMTLPVVGVSLVALPAINCPAGRVLGGYYDAWLLYNPAITTYVVSALGIVILVFWALHRWIDVDDKPRESHFIAFCQRYSRFSLTTYFAHYIILHWPIFLAAAQNSKPDPWFYFNKVCSTPWTFALSLVFDAVFYAVIVMWDRRHRSWYSLEWLERELFAMILNSKVVHNIKYF